MKIRQIIDKINDRQLFVPAFQREYVWKRNDAIDANGGPDNKGPSNTQKTKQYVLRRPREGYSIYY